MLYAYILVMAAVSYAIRALPMTLIRKPIRSRFIQSFLYYVPYVTLAVMTFPAIVDATQSPVAGALALIVGLAAAWLGAALCLAGLLLFAVRSVRLRPLAYACLAVGGVWTACGADKFSWALVPAAGLAAWAVSRAKSLSPKGRRWGCVLTALAACMLGLSAFAALCVMTAGRGLRERMVEWLGSAWFACALFMLYYDLDGSLLYKSGMLAVSGLAALAAYFALKRGGKQYAR